MFDRRLGLSKSLPRGGAKTPFPMHIGARKAADISS
jgi:hypothetical protein